MAAETLQSYLGGRWQRGAGVESELVDPTNGDVLASASAKGLDLKAALGYARERGGPGVRTARCLRRFCFRRAEGAESCRDG